ncbi:MAG: hypothetical protein KDK08_25740 [Rhizobiaceae bacterium]|nr:hypothetical protein [Rhizobiaceae bacterium]
MSRPATISQADCTRLARVAKAEGVCIEVAIGERIVRIYPDARRPENEQTTKPEEIVL